MSASTFAPASAANGINLNSLFDFAGAAARAVASLFTRASHTLDTDSEPQLQAWELDYLNEAGDIYDLEHRQRALDRGTVHAQFVGLGC